RHAEPVAAAPLDPARAARAAAVERELERVRHLAGAGEREAGTHAGEILQRALQPGGAALDDDDLGVVPEAGPCDVPALAHCHVSSPQLDARFYRAFVTDRSRPAPPRS